MQRAWGSLLQWSPPGAVERNETAKQDNSLETEASSDERSDERGESFGGLVASVSLRNTLVYQLDPVDPIGRHGPQRL